MKKICLISLLSESGFKSLTVMWLAESGRIINVSGMVIIARFSNWLIVYTCCLQIYLLIRKILGKSSTNFLGNEFCTFFMTKRKFLSSSHGRNEVKIPFSRIKFWTWWVRSIKKYGKEFQTLVQSRLIYMVHFLKSVAFLRINYFQMEFLSIFLGVYLRGFEF